MTRERSGLRRNTFHQIAVADQRVNIMIDDGAARPVVASGEVVFRDRHTDAVGESLAERSCRRLHSRGQSALRMPRSLTAPLAK